MFSSDDLGRDGEKASKALGKVAGFLGTALNVADAVKNCHGCSTKCKLCVGGVTAMLSVGTGAGCDAAVPIGCEVLGLGPLDPAADACAIGLTVACNALVNKIEQVCFDSVR
jgi:hypothetical protein